jgi:SAM-dependent methyltransferase
VTELGEQDDTAANRAWWDERVPLHLASGFYDLAGFFAKPDVLRAFELDEIGDVTGKRLLHLQCHIGLDTLSWATRGATVTGVDFSEPAVEAANMLAAQLSLPARFVTADVYDTARVLPGETFDIVYVTFGALNWLPELTRWAGLVTGLVAPGGFLYVADTHPVQDVLDDATGRQFEHDYFAPGRFVWEASGSYADPTAVTTSNVTIEHHHTLGAIVTAVATAGLRVEFLHEHDSTMSQRFDTLVRGDDTLYRYPPDIPRAPLLFSLRASKA